jgi:hypothetical protein
MNTPALRPRNSNQYDSPRSRLPVSIAAFFVRGDEHSMAKKFAIVLMVAVALMSDATIGRAQAVKPYGSFGGLPNVPGRGPIETADSPNDDEVMRTLEEIDPVQDKQASAESSDRYTRVPVLPPIPPGGPGEAIDPPSDDEVMRILDELDPGFALGAMRRSVVIQKEKKWDFIDPPRNYPLVGWAQLHHTRWKCTVTYTKVVLPIGLGSPRMFDNTVEVVDIDHDHLHRINEPTERARDEKPIAIATAAIATNARSGSTPSKSPSSQSTSTKHRRARWRPFFLR